MDKKIQIKKTKRCWEFFHCPVDKYKSCLLADTQEWRCWLVDISCCRIHKDAPQPLSIKKIFCKHCEYYKEYKNIK